MTPQEMRALYDYNAWANHRSLDAASKLTAEQFVQPMGSSFGSVRDTLAHIYGAEWIWLERFQGRSPASLPDTAQFKDIASLKERWNEHEARLIGFVRGLTQSPGSYDGIQDLEVRCLQQSSLAIDATSRQSRELSPRAGHDALAATRRTANPDRPDALLSRTGHRGGRVGSTPLFPPWKRSELSPG